MWLANIRCRPTCTCCPCNPAARPCPWNQPANPEKSGHVVERLIAGVVARRKRDARAAMASRAAEVEAVDRNRNVEESLRAGAVGSHQIRMQQAVAEVAGWRAEHGVHVIRRKRDVADHDVLEIRGEPGD